MAADGGRPVGRLDDVEDGRGAAAQVVQLGGGAHHPRVEDERTRATTGRSCVCVCVCGGMDRGLGRMRGKPQESGTTVALLESGRVPPESSARSGNFYEYVYGPGGPYGVTFGDKRNPKAAEASRETKRRRREAQMLVGSGVLPIFFGRLGNE